MGDTVSIPEQQTPQPNKPTPETSGNPPPSPLQLPAQHPQTPKKKKASKRKRCPQCEREGKRKRLTISNSLECKKCNNQLCTDHISAHDCTHNHHEEHKKLIIKKNPVIQFKKVDKI